MDGGSFSQERDGRAGIALLGREAACSLAADAFGLLAEHASDSTFVKSLVPTAKIYDRSDLLGCVAVSEQRAHALVQKLLDREPPVEGINCLWIYEEVLIAEIANIFQALHLHEWMLSAGFATCTVSEWTPVLAFLAEIGRRCGAPYQIRGSSGQSASGRRDAILPKLISEVRKKRLTMTFLAQLGLRASRRAQPLWSRWIEARMARPRPLPGKRGVWFYSTAQNYTNIGLKYEPYVAEPVHYLYEDPRTGGAPLRHAGREGWNLWRFVEAADVRAARCAHDAADMLVHHLRRVPLTRSEQLVRDIFVEESEFLRFFRRYLPAGIAEFRGQLRWMEDADPKLIIFGNSGFERMMLKPARERGIKTVLLQHGVLGNYYQLMDQPVDHILVRGKVFHDFLSEHLRNRAVILNYPQPWEPSPRRGRALLYLTSPYHILPNMPASEMRDIAAMIASAAVESGCELVVRIHPLDSIEVHKRIFEELRATFGRKLTINYSQGAGLEEALQSSAVAVGNFTTVFLECMRLGVPAISFGWHASAIDSMFRDTDLVHYARNLAHLRELLVEGLAGRLPPARACETILAQTTAEEISAFFRNVVESDCNRPSAAVH